MTFGAIRINTVWLKQKGTKEYEVNILECKWSAGLLGKRL
jgi:hypothetical protein